MEIQVSRSGHKIPLIRQVPLHSKIDPSKEWENFTKDIDFQKKVIVIGLGFGYHLTRLHEKSADFLVIENDLDLIRSFYQEQPLSFIPEIISGTPNEIIGQIEQHISENQSKDVLIKVHQPSLRANPELYEPLHKMISKWHEQRILNLITDSAFASLWVSNCYKNLAKPLQAPEIKNIHQNPAIILGSGYTLTQSLPWIKKNQSKLLIIAIPPVLEILDRYNIKPDLVILVDGGYANRYYLKKINVPLITYLFSSHAFIKRWQGEIYFLNGALPVDHYLIPEFPQIPLSGSAASTALELACALSNEVYFAGYDFSYVKKHYHYSGNPLEKELLMNSAFFQNLEKKNLELMERGQPSSLQSFQGKAIKTNLAMASYYYDFCEKINSKKQKQFFIVSEETVLFPNTQIKATDLTHFKDKNISIQKAPIAIPVKERLLELEKAYLEKSLTHPVIQFQMTRALLKKQNEPWEIKKSLLKIKKLLDIF